MGVTVEKTRENPGGDIPQNGQVLEVHYTGKLLDGSEFDSSHKRNKPFEFQIGKQQVIKGWDEGFLQLRTGEAAKLTCTPDYAYGDRGYPPVIPPKATLIFEVELLKIK